LIETLFKNTQSIETEELVKKCLDIIHKEVELPIIESINPDQLTNSIKLLKNNSPGLYNKSILFAGENTNFNINLLQDLNELKNKKDLDETALSFILEKITLIKGIEKIPILPFPSNEYQVKALQDIFPNKLTVITGPPGTGKSQFIANLLINLFLEGNSVLFVSHTNEAVDVVYQKINEQFINLMFRTGKKEFRQELKVKFNELIMESSKNRQSNEASLIQIQSLWQKILENRNKLLELDRLEQLLEKSYLEYKDRKVLFTKNSDLEESFKELLPNLQKLEFVKSKLDHLKNKIYNKKFSFFERIILFFFPKYFEKKKQKLFNILNTILPKKPLLFCKILLNQFILKILTTKPGID